MVLYKVKTRSFSAYVLSENMDGAVEKMIKWLNENNYGFFSDREVTEVDVIADSEVRYLPDHITTYKEKLFL